MNKATEKGLITREVNPGYNAVLFHGDGTCSKYWGLTERKARQKANDAILNDD